MTRHLGWSLARIQHESHKRAWAGFGDAESYHPLRDGKPEQGWEWAVDRLAKRLDISPNQRAAAYRFYEARQTLAGDIAPIPRGMTGATSETRYERAERICNGALVYVHHHPDLTPMRSATFARLFAPDQPTLEVVRRARPAGDRGARTNQREAIARVRWCCEVLANHFDEQPYEEARVNEKHMGVGEGWTRAEHLPNMQSECIASLERQGLQVFVAPSGNVYWRNPHAASVFEPLDTTPQNTPVKR